MSGDVSIERTPGAGLVLRCRRCDITEAILSDGGFARLLQQHDHESAPWRFDVPEVPDSVTAFHDAEGLLWVRRLEGSHLWSRYHGDGTYAHTVPIGTVIQFGGFPLVECPDPRAAS